jgi:hypothetical protein
MTRSGAKKSDDPREVVQETIFFGAFIRIGGRPVWLDDEVREVCGCGRAMSYVALVGYNVTSDDAPRFFIGEMALYFFRCAPCSAMTVVFQST